MKSKPTGGAVQMQAIYLDVTAEQLARNTILQTYAQQQKDGMITVNKYIRILAQEESEEVLQKQIAKIIVEESVVWVLQQERNRLLFLKEKQYTDQLKERVQQRITQMYTQLELFVRHDIDQLCGQNPDSITASWNIDGYLRFSAKKLKWTVQTLLQEEYRLLQEERERDEFIALLQFCAAVQPSLLDDVFITLESDRFTIVDVWGNDLQQIYLEALPEEEYRNVQMHDLLLSILMTMLPKNIHLFVREELQETQKKLIALLQQIFAQRLMIKTCTEEPT